MNLQGKLRCKIISRCCTLELQDKVNNWLREMPVEIVQILFTGDEEYRHVCIFYMEKQNQE